MRSMLRLDELLAVLEMAQAVGQRRFGHFDHEANSSAGPFPFDAEGRDTTSSQGETRRSVRYETFRDEETGELLHRPVKLS